MTRGAPRSAKAWSRMRRAASVAYSELTGPARADFDCDGDIDLDDYALLQAQFAGDLFDFASFLSLLGGPG